MSIDTLDENRFQAASRRRARKKHVCCACGETIRRGDLYVVTNICSYDGDVSAFKHCLRCDAIAQALWKAGAQMIDMHLNCGHTWEENHADGLLSRPCPTEVERLAFLTADDAQRELVRCD